jgi:hypothetical protein
MKPRERVAPLSESLAKRPEHFRREMVGSHGKPLLGAALDGAVDYVRSHPAVWEVALDGQPDKARSPNAMRNAASKASIAYGLHKISMSSASAS